MVAHKLRIFALIVIALLPMGVFAQPSDAEVLYPVTGKLLRLVNDTDIVIFDTRDGHTLSVAGSTIESIVNETPVWLGHNGKFAYSTLTDQGDKIVVFDTVQNPSYVSDVFNTIILLGRGNWNESNILYYEIDNVSSDSAMILSLNELDISTNEVQALLTFERGILTTKFPLPIDVKRFRFESINVFERNPQFDDWILLQIRGSNPDVTAIADAHEDGMVEIEQPVELNLLWNSVTEEFLFLNPLFDDGIMLDGIRWHPDGTKLFLHTYTRPNKQLYLLGFNPNDTNSKITIQKHVLTKHSAWNWLGVDDLLFTRQPDDDSLYISQMVGGELLSLRFLSSISVLGDWLLQADDTERRELSCLFDQTLPAQLHVSETGHVVLTDDTSSVLRAAPGLDAEIVTTLIVGDTFTVISEPECTDGYRWWQVQLEDKSVGFVIESNRSVYYLEPQ